MRTFLAVGSRGFVAVMIAVGCSSGSSPAGAPDTGAPRDSSSDRGHSPDHENVDTGKGGGGCAKVENILPTECESCSKSKCASELAACDCDPECVDAVKCYDGCSLDGGTGLECASGCTPMSMIGFESGAGDSVAYLNCITTKCTSVCTATSGEAGAEGGPEAGPGSEAGSGTEAGADGGAG